MTVDIPQTPPPFNLDDLGAIFRDAGLAGGQKLSESQIDILADKVISATGKGNRLDIIESLQSFQDLGIPIDENAFKTLVGGQLAFIPPPDLSKAGGGQPETNDFFLASLNTVLVEVVLEYIDFLKENDVVMGDLGVDNLKAMFDSAFERARNEIELGNKQAAKDMIEGVASLVSGIGSMITAGMSIKEVRGAKTQAAEDIKSTIVPREQSLFKEAQSLHRSHGGAAGENFNPNFAQGKSSAGRTKYDIDKDAFDLQSKRVEYKAGAFQKAASKAQIYGQISNSVEGIAKAVSSFVSASYDKEMGQIRAENVILEAGQKAAEQAWNKALDSLFKSNPQDRDAMANFLKELLAASARIGTSNA